MLVLGIESSCDETAAAVVDSEKLLSATLATQHDVHERFGGVVPELASRRHMENIVPLVQGALESAGKTLDDLEGVAVTCAPGLVGSLLVGISMAKGIAYAKDIPLIGVNHLEGHLNAALMEYGEIPLPYVGLVVSGGHTSIYSVKNFGDYELLGATRDDAAGEAFDKVAKLLGLGYPGGPAIDRAAAKGDPKAFRFSKPKFTSRAMRGIKPREFDFSFSGIKTAVLDIFRKNEKNGKISEDMTCDLAASFQETVANILTDRLIDAAGARSAMAVVLSGGVAANRRLRAMLIEKCEASGIKPFIPAMKLCTDNAAMIAFVGERHLVAGKRSSFSLNATANEEIGV
jgi:N6-L-threonylcarbamoyladenine synthase